MCCLQSDQDADIPLPNEPDDRDYHSDDSRNVQDAGSDDEGEDLQEDAERYCFGRKLRTGQNKVRPSKATSSLPKH